jgi:diguanylate cyclase (GGDEF)-like protein
LLNQVARRLVGCVRAGDTVARLGGDEFVVLLENNPLSVDVMLIERKIHAALATPLRLGDGRRLRISVSIGVAHYPEHGENMQQLLRHADRAMYIAKSPSLTPEYPHAPE